MRAFLATVMLVCLMGFAGAAEATPSRPSTHIRVHHVAHAHHHVHWSHRLRVRHYVAKGDVRDAQKFQRWTWSVQDRRPAAASDGEARPGDCYGIPWCGCYLRHLLGVADRSLNLAANWARWGHPSAPRTGAVVVWLHHVGIIRGGPDAGGRWLIESGNDGHVVRTRYRSLAGAIAFRQ